MNHDTGDRSAKARRPQPMMSLRGMDNEVIEMVLRRKEGRAAFVAWNDGNPTEHESLVCNGQEYVPYSPTNNLLTHRVVVLAAGLDSYEDESELLNALREFIHRYVDVSETFEEVAAHYVLLTWVYDTFNELPYLRVRGDYGTGKSRFLLTIGSICFKPIFASGASTVSPIFRLIDQIGGTLVIDEADFWASDERAEIIKILNNGNARGFPVLRNDVTPNKEFSPRAFNIFGPKIVATRHEFQDEALESRCLTEVLGTRSLRPDVPVSLPSSFEDEAEQLRNKLLMYRFRQLAAGVSGPLRCNPSTSPRRAQILAPLLSVSQEDDARDRIRAFAEGRVTARLDKRIATDREVLSSTKKVLDREDPLTLGMIAKQFDEDWGHRYGRDVASRWVGSVLRRLNIQPHKSNGVYLVPPAELPYLRRLFNEHGLGDAGDNGDLPNTASKTLTTDLS